MRLFVCFVAALLSMPASAQFSAPTVPAIDTSTLADLNNRVTAMEVGPVQQFPTVKAQAATAVQPAQLTPVQDAITALQGTVSTAVQPAAMNSAIAAATSGVVKSVNGAAPNASGSVTIDTLQFVSGFTRQAPGLVASLLANAPCNASRIGFYAIVSDLYSNATSTNEVLRCGSSGSSFYWRPQRTDYVANVTLSSGTMTFSCLLNAPTTFFNGGSAAGNLAITLGTTGCWPGAQADFANDASSSLFGISVGGLLGNLTKSLGLNGRQSFRFDGTSWRSL
jgi:hypothetical protein